MNISGSDQGSSKTHRFNDAVDVTGSHFALQVALQTMKERCQRLQQRLSFLEEENSRLKLKKFDGESNSENENKASSSSLKIQLEQMQEQLSQLTRQKSQLSHQIIMVVTENKQLWNRLSHMTKVNKSLGGHLTKISDTLNQHTSGSFCSSPKKSVSKAVESKQITSKGDFSPLNITKGSDETDKGVEKIASGKSSPMKRGTSDGSLEEISLKLLNSIQLEKTELEQQYAQMVEIHNDTSPSFNLNTMGLSFIYEDESQAVKIIKEHCKDLEKMKQSLLEQQVALKNSVTKFRALKDGVRSYCHQCLAKRGKRCEVQPILEEVNIGNASKVNEEVENKSPNVWDGESDIKKIENSLSVEQKNISNSNCNKEQMHICPMCGMKWSSSTPFEIFQKHVTDHFAPDDDDFTALENDFEAIP